MTHDVPPCYVWKHHWHAERSLKVKKKKKKPPAVDFTWGCPYPICGRRCRICGFSALEEVASHYGPGVISPSAIQSLPTSRGWVPPQIFANGFRCIAWTVQNPTKFGRLVDFPTHSALPPSLSPSNPTLCPPLIRVAAFFRVFDGFLLIIDHDFGRAAADAQGTPELPPVAKAAGAPVPVALSRDWTRFGRCSTTIYAERASHHSL